MEAGAATGMESKARREGLLVKPLTERLLLDKIELLQEQINKLEDENKVLSDECKFGATLSFLFGIALGSLIGVSSIWLS